VEVTSEHEAFMKEHRFGVLSTGRRDGSPQASMVGFLFDGQDLLVVLRSTSAKYHNMSRQPRVVLGVSDGRRLLTIYGDAEILEKDPERVDGFQAILKSYGMPETPPGDLAATMDEEQRVVVRIHPRSMELHE
jgi:PPOX class probable F420-dependent enzyme